MDVNLRLKVSDQASPGDLVWLAEQLERWAEDMLDQMGWNCIIESEAMTDISDGELPKSGQLRAVGAIELLKKSAKAFETDPPPITEHMREQLEAEMESVSPRGAMLIAIQVSDEDPISVESVAREAADALGNRLNERPNTAEVLRA